MRFLDFIFERLLFYVVFCNRMVIDLTALKSVFVHGQHTSRNLLFQGKFSFIAALANRFFVLQVYRICGNYAFYNAKMIIYCWLCLYFDSILPKLADFLPLL